MIWEMKHPYMLTKTARRTYDNGTRPSAGNGKQAKGQNNLQLVGDANF